jgi:hypothetical protein
MVSCYMCSIGLGGAGAVIVGLWSAASGRPHPRGWAEFSLLILLPVALSVSYLHGAYSAWGIGKGRPEKRSVSIVLASTVSLVTAVVGTGQAIAGRATEVHPLWVFLVGWAALLSLAIGGFVIFFKKKDGGCPRS